LESHARYLQTGKGETEKRPTNAVRYMQRFAVKPYSTWPQIYALLNPYIQTLNGAEGYQRKIDDIMALLSECEGWASDKPLGGKYLMGYSLQRIALSSKKDSDEGINDSTDNK
jgi:CRISPR-associated protein Csd1